MNKSQRSQIRNLLLVLGSGFLGACLFGLFMLYRYGPSGQYLVKDALLSPKLTQELNYNDTNSKTGGQDRFTFDKMEFAYFDAVSKQWKKTTVPLAKYQKWYEELSGNESILNPPDNVKNLFSQGYPATLTLYVKTESNAAWQALTKPFQEVQFVNGGDYYRIELREQNPMGKWVYFNSPGIYQKTIEQLGQ